MVVIKFDTDTATFEAQVLEVEKILLDIIGKMHGGRCGGFVRDTNGNIVGEWNIS